MTPRPIIIDTDPGQDDALAILLALASAELAVLGLTTVAGGARADDRGWQRALRPHHPERVDAL